MIVTLLIPYLQSTSNIALSCRGLVVWLQANGFPIRTSKGGLCLDNFSLYKLLDYSYVDEWMRRGMVAALAEGKIESLRLLLQSGPNIEAADHYGNTVLQAAAWYNNTSECMHLLIDYKADLKTKNNVGNTPLIRAAGRGKSDNLKILLGHKADPNEKSSSGNTALLLTAMNGTVDCLKILLEHKANPEAENVAENTALSLAVMYGKTDCLKVLLEHGAQVSSQIRADYPEYAEWWEEFYSLSRFAFHKTDSAKEFSSHIKDEL